MLNHSILPMNARNAPAREGSWRRTSHGGSAFANELNLVQPQDGAERRSVPGTVSPIKSRLSVAEPEDARLTGVTRSLYRRLTGLNIRTAPLPTSPAKALALRKPSRVTAVVGPQTQVA